MLLITVINNHVFTVCDISVLEYILILVFFSCAIKKKDFSTFCIQKQSHIFQAVNLSPTINVLNIQFLLRLKLIEMCVRTPCSHLSHAFIYTRREFLGTL